MKKNLLFFLLLPTIFPLSNCLAQNNYDIKRTMHWYFGIGAGLDFSSGSSVANTTGNMRVDEDCFTMSDNCGNLLFHGKSDTICNKNHQKIDNGDLVLPSCLYVTHSKTNHS